MEFRPCIDLHQGTVKQIVGSTLNDTDNSAVVNFSSSESAAYYADLYKQHNLYGGHVIKLGPGNDDAAKEALAAFPKGLHIGGGITTDNAEQWLNAGASHVIVTSFVFNNGAIQWDNLKSLVTAIGKENLVLDLSCKKVDDTYYIVTDRWQKTTPIALTQENFEELSLYCDEFLVHAASVEGKQQGPDTELIKLLYHHAPLATTYAGGVATLDDLGTIVEAGNNRIAVTIGSALDLFGGPLAFSEVVQYCNKSL